MGKVSAQDIEAVVFAAIDQLKEVLPPNAQMDRSRTALLLGEGTSLDSMAVVNLLVFIEEEMFSMLGVEIVLAGADEESSIPPEALETVGTLIDAIYAHPILND